VSSIASGIPAATVDDEPKLDRMSWRTTPVCERTSGPFDPSAGNGPAVSSGMMAHDASPEVAVDRGAAVAADELGLADPLGAQPMIVNSPALTPPSPRSLSIPRLSRVAMSNTRPRSWSSGARSSWSISSTWFIVALRCSQCHDHDTDGFLRAS
jgi:hypothetical protein